MNKIQCPEGHFFDSDLYSQCPVCEKMENISKMSSSKAAKKSLFGKKTPAEPEKPVVQQETNRVAPKNQQRRKKSTPAEGSVVTVAFYNMGNEEGEQPDNNGILDEEGRLVLKADSKKPAKKPAKKADNTDEYITAAEILNEKERKRLQNDGEDAEQEDPADAQVIRIEEEEFGQNKAGATSGESEDNEGESVNEEAEETEVADSEEESLTGNETPEETEKESEPEQSKPEKNSSGQSQAEQKSDSFTAPAAPRGSKTVGFYHFETDPVVGWLVCLSGDIKGKSFKLKSGQNVIGTSGIMDIYLPSENKSSEAQALLVFEPIKKEFILRARSAQCLVNEKEIKEYSKLKDYDKIKLCGYELVFKSLCNKGFDWKDFDN